MARRYACDDDCDSPRWAEKLSAGAGEAKEAEVSREPLYGPGEPPNVDIVLPAEEPKEVPAPEAWGLTVDTIVASMRHLIRPTRKGESVETIVELIVHLARQRAREGGR